MRNQSQCSVATLCVALVATALLAHQAAAALPADPKQPPLREIFVPFEDLEALLENQPRRVLLSREEYEDLVRKAKKSPETPAPLGAALVAADHQVDVQQERALWNTTLVIDVLQKGLQAVPLDLADLGLRIAMLGDKPAPIGRGEDGRLTVFVEGIGRHEMKLQMVSPLETTAATQVLGYRVPMPPAVRFRLTVRGDVEVKSGAGVVSREVDEAAGVTRFELLPRGGDASLVMTLNSRLQREQRAVAARSVLVDEITEAYEQLHATVSLEVLHRAVDQVRFALPEGFEIQEVRSPKLSRWAVETEDQRRILNVRLREQTTEPVVLGIVAQRTPPSLDAWTMPKLEPLDVVSHVAVVGLVVEQRLTTESVAADGLIPIDTSVLTQAIPESVLRQSPGAPPVAAVVAWYAPQPEFRVSARFVKPPAKVSAMTNVLLTVEDRGLQVRGGLLLSSEKEKLFEVDFTVPAGWHVTRVATSDEQPLTFERNGPPDQPGRVRVRLPQGVAPGADYRIYFQAELTPAGWLDPWQAKSIEFPVFAVAGAEDDIGALAVDVRNDLAVRPEKLERLTPLDDSEKDRYGLGGVETDLVYRYDSQPYQATLALERTQPYLTARTWSFLRVEPEGLTAHYELAWQIEEARTDRLVVLLPESTPEMLTIRGLDGLSLKESVNRGVENGRRRWEALLAEPRRGAVRLAVDFVQALPSQEPKGLVLPIVEAGDVAYQSGLAAVEGAAELYVQVNVSETARRVDVGELVDAQYQPGRRLLGVFGFAGQPAPIAVDVSRHPGYGLDPAIVQRAELTTQLCAETVSQTAAVYQLRTKAPYLVVQLPPGSTLWSGDLDEVPIKPQREADSLLVSLPAASTDSLRTLRIVYQTPIEPVGLSGTIGLAGPELLLRGDRYTGSLEVPVADLRWRVIPPPGHTVVRSDGTLTLEASPPEPAAIRVLKGILGAAFWSPGPVFLNFGCGMQSRQGGLPRFLPSPYFMEDDVQYPAGAESEGYFESMESAPQDERRDTSEADVKELREEAAESRRGLESKPAPQAAQPKAGGQLITKSEEPAQATAPQAPPTTAPAPSQPATQPPPARKPMSMDQLKGVRSLKINLEQPSQSDDAVEFHSLGASPRLVIALASGPRFDTLGWALALLVILVGFALVDRSTLAKTWWILLVALLGTLIPLVPGMEETAAPANMAVYAAALLVPFYLAAGVVRWFGRLFHRRKPTSPFAPTAAAMILAWLCMTAISHAEPAKPAPTADDRFTIQVVEPPAPVQVPEDAILLPYDPDSETGIRGVDKMLVPYAKYVELWNVAHPDEKLEAEKPPAEYALAGASYSARLEGEDYLLLEGQLQVDVFVDKPVVVPLNLGGGVLAKANLGGQPARLSVAQPQADAPNPQPQQQAVQQAELPPRAMLVLHIDKKGRHALELAVRIRLDRRGGWRVAEGAIPSAPATALTLAVPQAETEVRLGQVADRQSYETDKADEKIETTVGPAGAIRIEWRPKVAEGQVDRSLTARSAAVLDVQEDGLRLVWQLAMEFPRSQRQQFRVETPAGYLVEKVAGNNVRGWEVGEENGRQRVDVSLLKAARDSEAFELHLSRFAPIAKPDGAGIDVPVVTVSDAALHTGRVTVRRSPLLELRTQEVSGVTRTDLPPEAANQAAARTDESPLGLRPYEAYSFAAVPFTIRLAVSPVQQKLDANVQSVLRIAQYERSLESRIKLNVENRPLYRAEIFLPGDLKLDEVSAPGEFHWALTRRDDRPLLTVYLAGGSQGEVSIMLQGTLQQPSDAAQVSLPRIEVVGAQRQEGEIAVQADPAFDVRAVDLKNGETVLLDRLAGWLSPQQRPLTRLAVHHRGPDYGGTLQLTPREPMVACETTTNVRVTDRAVEETILLNFTVQRAGVRELAFLLPGWMKSSRIRVPMLREKTIEPAGEGDSAAVRVRLALQDEVMNEIRVLVENDRLLTAEPQSIPIPIVETGRTIRRYVVLESAGRDEVIVRQAEGLDPLTRQQREWQHLTGILGTGITQAYLASDRKQPKLVFAAERRKAWESAGARIGLSETDLVLDAAGTYRARLVYRLDNTTEQFLEVQMPPGSRLWTAQVAGEPVKPTQAIDSNDPHRVRIPLVKTAPGDLDYAVVLKYGGRTDRLGWLQRTSDRISFPLVHTVNIQVEESQVRLHLPENYRWFDFDGTMGPPVEPSKLAAGYVQYQTKIAERLVETMQTADSFAKVRAATNLKELKDESLRTHSMLGDLAGDRQLQQQIFDNSQKLQEAEQEAREVEEVAGRQITEDNRYRLNEIYAGQKTSRAKNVVSEMGRNWDVSAVQSGEKAGEALEFDAGWFRQNQLSRPVEGEKSEANAVAREKAVDATRLLKGKSAEAGQQQRDLRQLGIGQQMPQPGPAQTPAPGKPVSSSGSERAGGAVSRYQERLKQQQEGQQAGEMLGRSPLDYVQDAQPPAAVPAEDPFGMPAADRPSVVAGEIPQTPPPAPGLVSLDVDLPLRGTVYHFKMPEGDIEITARAVSRTFLERIAWGLVVVIAALVVLALVAASRRGRFAWFATRSGSLLLIVFGILSVLLGVAPLLGLVAFAAGSTLAVRRLFARSQPVPAQVAPDAI